MPKLGIIRIGEKQDDIAYERNAVKRCEKLSVAYEKFLLPEDVTEEIVIDTIQKTKQGGRYSRSIGFSARCHLIWTKRKS